jgi:30S ribosomal protein 3
MISAKVSCRRFAATPNVSRAPAQVGRSIVALAAEVDAADSGDNAVVYADGGAAEEPAAPAAAPAAEIKKDAPAMPSYVLNVLWMEKAIGVSVDQYLASGEKGPVTEYFMWPANDAWDQLKNALDGMPWISQIEVIHLLNDATEVINFWQDETTKHTMEEAQEKFSHIAFYGS